jgi:signal transduction histidine kinase
VRKQVENWKLTHEVGDAACLVMTEMATNSVLHSGSAHMRVRVVFFERHLRVEVTDDGTWKEPAPRTTTDIADNGRGFDLIEAHSASYGHHHGPDGTRSWACIPLPPTA